MSNASFPKVSKLASRMLLAAGLTLTAMVLPQTEARAQSYPSKPVKLIVPYRAGGGTDTMARIFGKALTKELGQPVVVVNHKGGGGAVGGSVLANSAADGYTIMLGGDDIPTYIPHASKVDFSLVSFKPIAAIAEYQNAFIAKSGAPFTNYKEFVDYAKSNPGVKLGHTGGVTQPFVEALVKQSGIDARVITTSGGAEVLQFLLAGKIDAGYSGGIHNQNPEQWEILGSFNESRLASAPEKETFKEAGFGMSMPAKLVIIAPSGMSDDVAKTLESAIVAASKDSDFVTVIQERLKAPVSLMIGADLEAYLTDLDATMEKLAHE